MYAERLHGSIDFDLMKSSEIMVIGIGGASGLVEDFARTGIGEIKAMDFDTVDESNITTQGYAVKNVGQPKVYALADRLLSINPELKYTPILRDLLELREDEIDVFMSGSDLLLFMTDNFYAQARGNRIALRLQKPAVFAMVYEKARCAEISFIIPGITPACHRCCTSPRYLAYSEGYENDVTSHGSTVMQTHYLNAAIGMISLAILNRNDEKSEFGGWFQDGKPWEKNLVQLRMNPRYGEDGKSSFDRIYGNIDRVFTFDSNWIPVEPDSPPKNPPCPDCGGTGDLRLASKWIHSTTPAFPTL